MDRTYVLRLILDTGRGVINMIDISNNGISFYMRDEYIPLLNPILEKVGKAVVASSALVFENIDVVSVNRGHSDHNWQHPCGDNPTHEASHAHLKFYYINDETNLHTMSVQLLGVFMQKFRDAYEQALKTGGVVLLTGQDIDFCMSKFKELQAKGFPNSQDFVAQKEEILGGRKAWYVSDRNTTDCGSPLDLPFSRDMLEEMKVEKQVSGGTYEAYIQEHEQREFSHFQRDFKLPSEYPVNVQQQVYPYQTGTSLQWNSALLSDSAANYENQDVALSVVAGASMLGVVGTMAIYLCCAKDKKAGASNTTTSNATQHLQNDLQAKCDDKRKDNDNNGNNKDREVKKMK